MGWIFRREIKGFSTKPRTSCALFAGGSFQQPRSARCSWLTPPTTPSTAASSWRLACRSRRSAFTDGGKLNTERSLSSFMDFESFTDLGVCVLFECMFFTLISGKPKGTKKSHSWEANNPRCFRHTNGGKDLPVSGLTLSKRKNLKTCKGLWRNHGFFALVPNHRRTPTYGRRCGGLCFIALFFPFFFLTTSSFHWPASTPLSRVLKFSRAAAEPRFSRTLCKSPAPFAGPHRPPFAGRGASPRLRAVVPPEASPGIRGRREGWGPI